MSAVEGSPSTAADDFGLIFAEWTPLGNDATSSMSSTCAPLMRRRLVRGASGGVILRRDRHGPLRTPILNHLGAVPRDPGVDARFARSRCAGSDRLHNGETGPHARQFSLRQILRPGRRSAGVALTDQLDQVGEAAVLVPAVADICPHDPPPTSRSTWSSESRIHSYGVSDVSAPCGVDQRQQVATACRET